MKKSSSDRNNKASARQQKDQCTQHNCGYPEQGKTRYDEGSLGGGCWY